MVNVLGTTEGMELRENPEDMDLSERSYIPYEFGPLFGSIEAANHQSREKGGWGAHVSLPQDRYGLSSDDHDVNAEACRHLIDLTKLLYQELPKQPALVFSTSPTFEATSTPLPDITKDGAIDWPRKYITWLDIYTPDEVEIIGRKTLMSAPAPRIDELTDGSVLIASKHPLEVSEHQLDDVGSHLAIPTWLELLY
jgi:hypothetical protein